MEEYLGTDKALRLRVNIDNTADKNDFTLCHYGAESWRDLIQRKCSLKELPHLLIRGITKGKIEIVFEETVS